MTATWKELLAQGWSTGPMKQCIRCQLPTIARDHQGNPHHAVCPKDIKIPPMEARKQWARRGKGWDDGSFQKGPYG